MYQGEYEMTKGIVHSSSKKNMFRVCVDGIFSDQLESKRSKVLMKTSRGKEIMISAPQKKSMR